MRKYMVYIDAGQDTMKIAVPANSVKAAKQYVEGNGEVVAVKDITDDFPIRADYVADALKAAGFGKIEIDLIIRTLTSTRIAE